MPLSPLSHHWPEPIFNASKTKLKRALKFINEFKDELAGYQHSGPISARLRMEADPPDIFLEFAPVGLMPGAIVGDAIHNLRSALDLMASELARINGRSDKSVYFPFSDSADTFDEAIKKKNFHRTGQDSVDLLREFSPYRGGNEDLRAIHDLDISDKHTALIVTPHTLNVAFSATYDLADLNKNTVCAVVDSMTFRFPDGTPLAGRDVVETLEELVKLTDGILQAFASLVAARA